jgi:hypothetical protein
MLVPMIRAVVFVVLASVSFTGFSSPVEAPLPSSASLSSASPSPQDPIAKVAAERLDATVIAHADLSSADKLAGVCLQAHVACGFELVNGVWRRPESRRPLRNVTAARALAHFIGHDYRLAWIGPVVHVFPVAADASRPLDTEVAADISMNSPSHEQAETIRDVALKAGLQMPVPRRRRRAILVGASTMPVKNSARYILDQLCRPALARPSAYIAMYGPGRAGGLRWYWGKPPRW